MSAAAGAAAEGASVLLVDERPQLGGILPQCIHNGFGRGFYGQDLTGPDYCEKEVQRFSASGASYILRARAEELRPDLTALISAPEGLYECSFDQCVLATGCREKTIYSLEISGTRPEGVFTAGEAQEMLKIARRSPLYPRIKRDTVIIYCLHNHVSLVDTQIILQDLELPLLGGREK